VEGQAKGERRERNENHGLVQIANKMVLQEMLPLNGAQQIRQLSTLLTDVTSRTHSRNCSPNALTLRESSSGTTLRVPLP
jgi:hypothetical protein